MPLTDIWTDIAWEGIAKEGNVTFKKGKKPEKLIQLLIIVKAVIQDVANANIKYSTTIFREINFHERGIYPYCFHPVKPHDLAHRIR